MKKHAAVLKNLAAVILLAALLTLLLPLGKVAVANKTATVSGTEVLKIGMNVAYEYYQKGSIGADYVLTHAMTWGDVKSGITYVAASNQTTLILVASGMLILPIVFCFLAMCLTLLARGKKTMFLSTLLVALAVMENIMLMFIAFELQQALSADLTVTLLVGTYAFTALMGLALAIVMGLWVTGGFAQPTDKAQEGNRKERRDRRRASTSSRDKGREKRKKRRKKRKKNNKKTKKNKQEHPQDLRITQSTGRISGLTGMYEGINVTLPELKGGSFTLGTTPQVVEAIQKEKMNEMTQISKNSCSIKYSEIDQQYKISCYSITEIQLQTEENSEQLIRLQYGDSQCVSPYTVLLVENSEGEHCLRLE